MAWGELETAQQGAGTCGPRAMSCLFWSHPAWAPCALSVLFQAPASSRGGHALHPPPKQGSESFTSSSPGTRRSLSASLL